MSPFSQVAQRSAFQCKSWRWVQSLCWEDPPGGGHGNPLQHSCLGNPMDKGAWRTTAHGVEESDRGHKTLLSKVYIPLPSQRILCVNPIPANEAKYLLFWPWQKQSRDKYHFLYIYLKIFKIKCFLYLIIPSLTPDNNQNSFMFNKVYVYWWPWS